MTTRKTLTLRRTWSVAAASMLDLVAFAAAGDDRLLGGTGDDGLDGGPGFDRLNGQAGVDSCVNGEVLLSCEATANASQALVSARAAIGYGRR